MKLESLQIKNVIDQTKKFKSEQVKNKTKTFSILEERISKIVWPANTAGNTPNILL